MERSPPKRTRPLSSSHSIEQELASILFPDTLQALQDAVQSGAHGLLLSGSDAPTRRALATLALPTAQMHSALHPSLSQLVTNRPSSPLILHDVDTPAPALSALLDAATAPVLATAARLENVPASLQRAHRLDTHIAIRAATPGARACAWRVVMQRVGASDKAPVSPALGVGDLLRAASNFYITGGIQAAVQDEEEFGGYADLKRTLERTLGWPTRYASTFEKLGARAPRGVLLHGARGVGKTKLARVMSKRIRQVNWQHVEAHEIYSRYLGESEGNIRKVFAKARRCAPCIIMIDDIEALAANRADDEEGSGVEHRVLGTLLAEMDGISDTNVQILACTSSLNDIDAALLRPGRMDKILHIPYPSFQDRFDIIMSITRNIPVRDQHVLRTVAFATDGRTAADLAAVCRKAALFAMSECEQARCIEEKHFMAALSAQS